MDTTLLKAHNSNIDELYELSLQSAKSQEQEVFIFELGELSDILGEQKAEDIRKHFLKNNTQVKQISNSASLPKFSENDDFVNKIMSFRYVPKDIFDINKEILIFDDIVAIYDRNQTLIIQDKNISQNYKQLFMGIWKEGESPKLGFEYKPNHSFYKNLNYHLENTQIIIWPDADAKQSYNNMTEEEIGEYIKNIIKADEEYYKDSSYIIGFIWSMDNQKMVDIWKFNDNHVDDRSGPLSEARVYKEAQICHDLGLANGNTLLVLGYEEKLRRQSQTLKNYLDGPAPKLPLEMMNGLDFFE